MKPRPFAVIFGLLAVVTLAAAAPRDDVAAATREWIDAYNSRDPERVLALYDEDAVLWGTASPVLRDTPAGIRDYFKTMPERPLARVVLGEERIRVLGDVATNSGYYTFTNVREGRTESISARFSFTYQRRDGRWMIVTHHSSASPPALK